MAHGVTEDMKRFTRQMEYRTLEPREQRERDRSLRGKARIKARKGK